MKTAKEILGEKGCSMFDMDKACSDIERFFRESDTHAKLIVKAGRIEGGEEGKGYSMLTDDEIGWLVSSGIPLDKIGDISSEIAVVKVESSYIRKLIDKLKENKFFTKE